LPELFVDAGVAIVDCELEERRRDGDVLEDGDALLVWTEHGRIVIGVGDSQFDVRHVDVRHVRVLDVHRQVERRIQQRVVVHRLHAHHTMFYAD